MTDERDPRDKDVDTAWRAHVRDEPPRALDDAIRAAAHRAVQSAPRVAAKPPRRAWTAWAPLAVAATLGAIALGVVQVAPHETDATREVVSDAARSDVAQPGASWRVQRPPADAQPSAPAGPSAAPPATPSASSPAAPVAQSAATMSRPAAPAPAATTARKNEAEREDRVAAAPPAAREGAVDAASPRITEPQSKLQSANRAKADALAGARTPDPFPAAAPEPPAQPTDTLEAKRATPANRIEDASRDAAAAPPAGRPATAAPARTEQAAAPAAESGRRKDAAPFAEPPADRAATRVAPPAQPAPAPVAAPLAAPATSDRASEGTAAGTQALAKAAPLRTPDDYFSAIRRLRDEGREADAIATLAAYRAAFGDDEQKLPGDLRLWAMRVTRP